MLFRERKRNRLKGFDYTSENAYFITFCTKNRMCWFGDVQDEKVILNDFGKIVESCWYDLSRHYTNCVLGDFVIMPNHFHGIIFIDNTLVRNGLKPFPTHGLSEIVRALKTFSSRKINENIKQNNYFEIPKFQWQKSYYDHIIRNEKALDNIQNYIQSNLLQWLCDDEFSEEKILV